MKRITRNRQLTPEEAAKYQAIREQVAEELPDLVARHQERMATLDQLQELLQQLKAAREAKGLSLADLTDLTGMDRSALSKLETGQRQPHRGDAGALRRGRGQASRGFADGRLTGWPLRQARRGFKLFPAGRLTERAGRPP